MELKRNTKEGDAVVNFLLIVPYGIETEFLLTYFRRYITFNCTLWN